MGLDLRLSGRCGYRRREAFMIRLTQLHLPVSSEGQDKEEERRALRKKTASLLGIPEERIKTLRILRRSIDARKKPSADANIILKNCFIWI